MNVEMFQNLPFFAIGWSLSIFGVRLLLADYVFQMGFSWKRGRESITYNMYVLATPYNSC